MHAVSIPPLLGVFQWLIFYRAASFIDAEVGGSFEGSGVANEVQGHYL